MTKTPTTQNRYETSDFYVFGYKKNDTHQKGQHGFPVPLDNFPDDELSIMNDLLPEETYCNPGGFPEKWEIRRVKSKTVLIIPQEFLANYGAPFKVFGSFTQ